MQGSAVTLSLLLGLASPLCHDFGGGDSAVPHKVIGVECRDVTLPCQVSSGSFSLDRRTSFSWSRLTPSGGGPSAWETFDCSVDGASQLAALYTQRTDYTVDSASCNLTIRALRPSDAGCYQCDVWGPSGTFCSYVKLEVIDPVRSVSVRQLSPWIVEGAPAAFACSAGPWHAADIGRVRATWLLDGAVLPDSTAPPPPATATASPDCLGRIESVVTVRPVLGRNHSGSILECEIRPSVELPPLRGSLRIPTVLVPPTSVEIVDRGSGRRYSRQGAEALVVGRENATFDCLVADTMPAAGVSWLYRGLGPVVGGRSTETVTRSGGRGPGTLTVRGTLVLPGLGWPDDGAELACLATGAGNISVSLAIKILVDAPPQNVTLSSSGVVLESAPSVFVCTAGKTRTASSIVWYLDDVDVTPARNASYSPERLRTVGTVALQVRRQQTGARLRCDVHHRLLRQPISSEITLDVNFCTPPSLSCPAVLSTSETRTLTCATPGGRPPANLSLSFEKAALEPLGSAGHQLLHRPADAAPNGGVSTVLTANLTGRREYHGRTVVCRRLPSPICPREALDTCVLNVHFPPQHVQLSEGSDPETDANWAKLAVQVSESREYTFTCGAIGSNPAASIRWLVAGGATETETETETEAEAAAAGSWTARRRITLVAGRDVLHGQNLTCQILYPAGVVYRELSLELSVIRVDPFVDTPSWTLIVIIACSAAVVLVIVLFMIVTLCKRTSSHRRAGFSPATECSAQPRELNGRQLRDETGEGAGPLLLAGADAALAGCEAFEFPRERLALSGVIGSGSFGRVYRATAEGIYEKGVCSTVAVKTPNPCGSPAERQDFLKELQMLPVLAQHPNVVSLLGFCREKDPVYLIMEYVPNGNLENYLRREKHHLDQCYTNMASGSTDVIGPVQILGFALQIARGMTHLASVQCIHRDLATRNILLDEHFVCKVSDFGLARHVPVQKQYEMKSEGRVPFRWMAPESILYNMYTTKSDVWSFGVLLWELITLGSHPYPGQSCTEIVEDLKKGIRLKKPAHCSDEVYQLMEDCWEGKPDGRPDFDTLHTRIEGMLSNASGYLIMSNFKTDQYVYMAPGTNSK